MTWSYVVLDEGHKIKNHETLTAKSLQHIDAQYRLILTGTPLQNNLVELWSLLYWLYEDVFSLICIDSFEKAFDIKNDSIKVDLLNSSGKFLDLIMLRRKKELVDKMM